MDDPEIRLVKLYLMLVVVLILVMGAYEAFERNIQSHLDKAAIEAGLEQREVNGEILWVKPE